MTTLTGIRSDPLSLTEVVEAVARAEAGAVASFVGVVRDHSEGRAVTSLEYHCYRTMAERELQTIAQELVQARSGVAVACLHRVGSLVVGDVAVVCAASAAHRGEAFDACRDLIDRVKARVPIWKREHGPDGVAWVGWTDARTGPSNPH
ncbi:MAG: molybdenum cofactor biosynthesis protein MoaE [Myxococcota bacterium]